MTRCGDRSGFAHTQVPRAHWERGTSTSGFARVSGNMPAPTPPVQAKCGCPGPVPSSEFRVPRRAGSRNARRHCYDVRLARHLSSAVEQCFRKAQVWGSNPQGGCCRDVTRRTVGCETRSRNVPLEPIRKLPHAERRAGRRRSRCRLGDGRGPWSNASARPGCG